LINYFDVSKSMQQFLNQESDLRFQVTFCARKGFEATAAASFGHPGHSRDVLAPFRGPYPLPFLW